jgi:Gpi18-like mannosyltransferase
MPGNEFDVGVNQGWARSAVQLGFGPSYSRQVNGNMLPNYPPLSMLIFGGVGRVYSMIVPDMRPTPLFTILIKLPAIVADMATALLLAFMIGRWKGRAAGVLGGFIYAVHPAVIYDSAVWGQTDSLFTFAMIAGLAAWSRGWTAMSAFLCACAVLLKAQTVMLLPLFALLFTLRGPKALLLSACAGIGAVTLTLLPYAGHVSSVFAVYRGSVGYYPIVSSAAYNLWWALLGDSAGTLADTTLFFSLMPYRTLGMLIYATVTGIVLGILTPLLRYEKNPARAYILVSSAGAVMAFAFFLFNTEMHERYLFPFLALGLPMCFIHPRGAFIYAGISICFLWNLFGWLPFMTIDQSMFRNFPALDIFIASAQVFLFYGMVRFLAQWVRRLLRSLPEDIAKLPTWKDWIDWTQMIAKFLASGRAR